jgi:hypothetical protein
VLDKVPPLNQFVKPYLYFLFILWLPFSTPRAALMVIAFFFGLTMDYFAGTPGLHTIPCVLIAYLRPYVLAILVPQQTTEISYFEPSIKSLGFAPYSIYILLLTFIHHTVLVYIEWMMNFGNFLYFITKVTATTGISLLLIFVTEMLFYRKARYRTNAA